MPKEIANKPERLTGGHRLCAGCGAPINVRQVMSVCPGPAVVSVSTGCLEVSTTIYPYTAWKDSMIHSAFENAGATISGVETAYNSLKKQRKDLTAILVAHDIPYAATASPHNFKDLMNKAEKAFATPGPAFINVISPCPRGWRTPGDQTIALAKEAVQSCYWPLYEVENGKYKINYKPKGDKKTPVADWLKKQGRFAHLFKPGNEAVLADIQDYIDRKWEELIKKEECL